MTIRARILGQSIAAMLLGWMLWISCSGSKHGSYLVLAFAYFFFFLPFLAWTIRRQWTYHFEIRLFSFIICLSLVSQLLFKESHRYPLYPLTTSLAYLLLLVVLIRVIHGWIFSRPYSIQYHFQKRYLLYGLGLIALLFGTTTMDQSDPLGPHFQLRIMVWILMILLIVNWVLGQWRMVKSLEAANATAELMQLKNQIQPHFLFNTLNNLYGLAREKSDLTADMIMRLSELLRYGLYQASRDRVELATEIEYLTNYMTLQQLRYAADITINTRFDIGSSSPKVSPLILIPLVENAFKHGADQLAEGAFINLECTVNQNVLSFVVENNIHPQKPASTPGIGLENLKKRLQLVYPNRHQFTFSCDDTQAKAMLSIQL